MVVLGITGRRRRAATAVAVDGIIVAAVCEATLTRVPGAGYRECGFPLASMSACLAKAGLTAESVDVVVSAEARGTGTFTARGRLARAARAAGLGRATFRCTNTLDAVARQSAVGLPSGVTLIMDLPSAAAGITRVEDGLVSSVHHLADLSGVLGLTSRLGCALGLEDNEPDELMQSLELLARSLPDQSGISFEGLGAGRHGTDVRAQSSLFDEILARAVHNAGASLRDRSNPSVRVQRVRAQLAEGFLDRLASLATTAIVTQAQAASAERAVLAGSAFQCPDFNARVCGSAALAIDVAPAPIPEGAALGAALQPFAPDMGRGLPTLALGPDFTEADAKKALENSRLDYVYEPVWSRLIERAAHVLAQGKLVAWFQESAEFGAPLLASRSVLADPSNRYARDNVNRFLRHRREDWPIEVSIAADAQGCLGPARLSPWRFVQAPVHAEWRERLRAAMDRSGSIHAHVVQRSDGGMFHDLLAAFVRRTGVPGLINVPLHGPGEPTVCSPRDAIRATYSSAVDALVMQRFLVMKDYWLLRASV
jgi:carbamoyltransferase